MKTTNTTLRALSQAMQELFSARDWGEISFAQKLGDEFND